MLGTKKQKDQSWQESKKKIKKKKNWRTEEIQFTKNIYKIKCDKKKKKKIQVKNKVNSGASLF